MLPMKAGKSSSKSWSLDSGIILRRDLVARARPVSIGPCPSRLMDEIMEQSKRYRASLSGVGFRLVAATNVNGEYCSDRVQMHQSEIVVAPVGFFVACSVGATPNQSHTFFNTKVYHYHGAMACLHFLKPFIWFCIGRISSSAYERLGASTFRQGLPICVNCASLLP